MEEMRELVDIRTVQTAVYAMAGVMVVAGIAVGAVVKSKLGSAKLALIRGGLVASLGPMLFVAWHLYSHLTRYDPETGYFGLDKVWVLALCMVIFIAGGVGFGFLAGRAWQATEGDSADTANEGGSAA